jgi:alpha-ketoglutarate-dependent taurine dioxygenase
MLIHQSLSLTQSLSSTQSLSTPSRAQGVQGVKASSNGQSLRFTDQAKATREIKCGQSKLTARTGYLHVTPNKNFVQNDLETAMDNASTDVGERHGIGRQCIIRLLSRVKGQHVNPQKN